ncbi:MAG: aldo/keto reductase [Betaproteobacteria bacterium]|nr:aldo/keto reductase [Betaproteobacteria bacterium]
MQTRELGRSGLKVVPLAFGGNVFGWTADAARSFQLLDAFVDAGCNLIDTADVYSRWVPGNRGGESESLIGQWLARSGRRNQVLIATKAGMDMGEGNKGLSPAYLRRAVDASLQRLGIDCIDLYQAHQDDADTPLEDTLGAFADLIKAGKVRAIGASNYTAPRLAQALAVSARLGLPRYETLQPGYNLADRAGFEAELQPLCVREGLSVIPYYSLAAGFLSGKYRKPEDLQGRARGARAGSYLNERGLRILVALDAVAARLGTTQTAVAIAWLRDRPAIAAPIASATSVEQLQALLAGLRLPLDAAAVAELDAASA